MPEKRISKARLIEEITRDAMMEGHFCRDDRHYDLKPEHKKVGYRIRQLSEEQREVLKTATDKDFNTRLFK